MVVEALPDKMNALLHLAFIYICYSIFVKPALIHFFGDFGATRQAVNINILSPYKVVILFTHLADTD